MQNTFQFDPADLPPECKELRKEVRAFLKQEIDAGTFSPQGKRGDNAALFAKKVGAKGWIGMTWPKEYGGHGRTQLERYVVTEEMLAHRPPTANPARCCCATARKRCGRKSSRASSLASCAFALGCPSPIPAPTCSPRRPARPRQMAAGWSTAARSGRRTHTRPTT